MKINRSDILFSELLEFDRINQYTCSITTSLRVKTSIVENVLNVTCTTLLGVSPPHTSTSMLHIAGYYYSYRLFICPVFTNIFANRHSSSQKFFLHIQREWDIFHSSTRASRYVWWRRSSNWSLHYSSGQWDLFGNCKPHLQFWHYVHYYTVSEHLSPQLCRIQWPLPTGNWVWTKLSEN